MHTAVQLKASMFDIRVNGDAVPSGPLADAGFDWQDNGKERRTAEETIKSLFCYHPSGNADLSGISISATGSVTEENISAILDPESILASAHRPSTRDAAAEFSFGLYLDEVRKRMLEIPESGRAEMSARRKARIERGALTETYRRIEFAEALRRLTAGLAPT